MKTGFAIALGLLVAPGSAMAQGGVCSPALGCTTGGSYYAYGPAYGNPGSLQFQSVRDDLNLVDVDPEGTDRMGAAGDSDTVGFAATTWGVTGQNGERYDLHYQHARRVFEGSRARLIIDVPVNISHPDSQNFSGTGYNFTIPGATAVAGTINVGLELPVKPNWLVTPRLSYGVALAGNYFGGNAEMATGSLTSRYRIAHVGRGDLVIGDSIAYTHTIKLLAGQNFFAPTVNWVFRNGVAYQYPLKTRLFGRQTSVRGSYVLTINTKDPVAYKTVHEVGLSVGIRTREAEQKNGFEQWRIGLLYTHADDHFFATDHYDSGTVTLGYRF